MKDFFSNPIEANDLIILAKLSGRSADIDIRHVQRVTDDVIHTIGVGGWSTTGKGRVTKNKCCIVIAKDFDPTALKSTIFEALENAADNGYPRDRMVPARDTVMEMIEQGTLDFDEETHEGRCMITVSGALVRQYDAEVWLKEYRASKTTT